MSGFTLPSYAEKYFPLKLYNVGQPRESAMRADLSGLNQSTSFYLGFSDLKRLYPTLPSYPVNAAPTVDRTGDDFYFTVNSDGTFTQKPVSSATDPGKPLSFSFTGSSGSISTTTTPTVAPDSPMNWSEYLNTLQYSDNQFSTLVAGAAGTTFEIPGVGLGLLATTDGMGHVSNVQIDMSYQGLTRWGMDVLSPLYNMLDRESILLRASMSGPAASVAQDNNMRVGKAADSNNPGITSLIPASVSPAGLGLASTGLAGINTNPVLNRLAALQPRDLGLLVSGFNSQLDLQGNRNLASSQAGLDVFPSLAFKQNLQQLTQSLVTSQPKTEPKTPLAQELFNITQQQFARQMDGKVPLVAVLPGNNPLPSATTAAAADIRPTMGVEDALSKKSSAPNPFMWLGAHLFMAPQRESIPVFPQQQPQPQQFFTDSGTGGGASAGGGFGGYPQGGNQNPFAGGFSGGGFGSGGQEGQQQLYRPRNPISYVA